MTLPSPTFGSTRVPIVDKDGRPTWDFLKFLNDVQMKTLNTLTLAQQLSQQISLQGRTEPLVTTVKNLNNVGALQAAGIGFTINDPPGQVGSAKIKQNVMSNYSNNATVDSIDNGVNATIRVYGPGGPGTTWHQFIGSGIGPEIPAFSGAAAYSTDFNVYYDGSFHITTAGSDTLPDGIQFSGGIHTVAAGGGGGIGGGGGSGGG